MFTFPPAKAKTDARTEYRVQEGQRVEDSQTLTQTFPDLNSLSITVAHFRPPGDVQVGAMKLTYNIGLKRQAGVCTISRM